MRNVGNERQIIGSLIFLWVTSGTVKERFLGKNLNKCR